MARKSTPKDSTFIQNNAPGFRPDESFGLSKVKAGVLPGEANTHLRRYFLSNDRTLLSYLYSEIGLIKTICRIPVIDALRGGVTFTSKQLSEDQIGLLTKEMSTSCALEVLTDATIWSRLFGGGAVLINDHSDDWSTPLDQETIYGKKLSFIALDMWELYPDEQRGYPSLDEQEINYYTIYGKQVHPSRVIEIKGLEAPSFLRMQLRGWGMSVIEDVMESLNTFLRLKSVAYDVLNEFKVDVYKIKQFRSSMLQEGAEMKLAKRIGDTNRQKSYMNAITIDSEDDFLQKQVSFSGIADIMKENRIEIASAWRMPMTKLFGLSASGFNSGEDDIEVYNAMIESEVRDRIKPAIHFIADVVCQNIFGMVPDDLDFTFQNLRMMSSEQEETVKAAKYQRLLTARESGLITDKEFREGVNHDDLLGLKLDLGFQKEDSDEQVDQTAQYNSLAYDKADFEHQVYKVPQERYVFFDSPSDKGLWDRAISASKELYGEERRDFTIFWYEQQGGKFSNGDQELIANPGDVDEGKWDKAKGLAAKDGKNKSWALVSYLYSKLGGTFKRKE